MNYSYVRIINYRYWSSVHQLRDVQKTGAVLHPRGPDRSPRMGLTGGYLT